MDLRELTSPVALCTADGRLDPRAIGFSRAPVHTCNLCGSALRKKRWDYFCVVAEDAIVAVTLADVDYLRVAVASLFLPRENRWIERAAVAPFARGIALPERVRGGDVSVRARELAIDVREREGETILEARFETRGVAAFARAVVDRRAESLSVVVPWTASRFQMTSKAFAMKVRGEARAGARAFDLTSPRAFAFHDFGRGVWPYRTRWQWAAAGGAGGGFNLGGTWTRGTGATENAILVDGSVHRVSEELAFERDARGVPRRIRGARVELAFDVEQDRALTLDVGLLASRLRWGLGKFRGRIVADDGCALDVDGMRGFAEDHAARW